MAHKEIFRNKEADISHKAGQYIRSADRGGWLALAAVAIVLLGIVIWGIYGRLDTVVDAGAVCKNGSITLYIPEEKGGGITAGTSFKIDGKEYVISQLNDTPVQIQGNEDAYALHLSGLSKGDFAYVVSVPASLPDGTYKAVITVLTVAPVSYTAG
ncbi:MAG: hypothetical protein IKP75_09320 [Oscillospiraceae bacterium]|nr:hypothetical protein [Oscillospiraceae bacterium]